MEVLNCKITIRLAKRTKAVSRNGTAFVLFLIDTFLLPSIQNP
jgi:hypothetical protein